MNSKSNIQNIVSWIFGTIIFIIGVLNLILVHPVPGIVYMLLSLIFLPPVNVFIKKKIGFGIPFIALVFFFLIIMWGTLAITDLTEMAGF